MIREIACAFGLLFASSALPDWQEPSSLKKGVVVSADVSGHGLDPNRSRKDTRGESDIWWTYHIKSDCFSYSIVSRRTPSQAALQPSHTIRFWEKKNMFYILDRSGNQLALKIVRKDKSLQCR
jgi:hypothetical protein